MKLLYATLVSIAMGSPAAAKICDYRMSQLIGPEMTSVIGAGGAGVATGGIAFNVLGFYTFTHASSGLVMIGSTAAGTSAAGTVGIIGGTSGVVGTVAAIVSAPATIIVVGIAAVGTGVLEGGCYFSDEKITEYGQVLAVLEWMNSVTNDEYFFLTRTVSEPAYIEINYDGTGLQKFLVADLYVVNGILMNRDWLRNTNLGLLPR